jgi:hypothetical protein
LSLYLDASAILPMFVHEASSAAVAAWIRGAPAPFAVSEFAAAETAAALSRLTRTGDLSPDEAARSLDAFDAWRAQEAMDPGVEPSDLRLASRFVRRFDLALRAPDAVHAAVCLRGGHTLVTLDRRLAAAAQALGVATTIPD